LKAIVTVCSSDDRYNDDVHYFGGALLGVDMLAWATTMLAFTARPPDPIRVDDWESLWRQRLDAVEPYLDTWLSHQTRDEYWRRGSVCEDYGAIKAAVLAVGGWADPYRGTVLRLIENLSCPAKGIIGPWPHQYPDILREPGPAIGFLQETLRWWDQYLKGEDTGVESEPLLRSWMQESVRPATRYATRPGRWVTEPSWPSPNVSDQRTPLTSMTCPAEPIIVATPQHCGIDAGRYFPFGNPADLPPDQREEDGRSVCFDTRVLTESTEILGVPGAILQVTADGPANVIVRLCDVAPDGSSTLVTRGCATVDGSGEVAVPMVAMAWSFPPGHRIRLSVATSYFPWIWPHPQAAAVSVLADGSALVLPVRATDAPSEPVLFQPQEQSEPLGVTFHGTHAAVEREVRYVPQTKEWQLIVDPNYGGSRTYPDGLIFDEQVRETYSIRSDDPASAQAGSEWRIRLRRPGWDVRIEVNASMRMDDGDYVTQSELFTFLNNEPVLERSWKNRILRVKNGESS
jgi:putative CocE/NonD family hydrolase